jgi:hypothetical protein
MKRIVVGAVVLGLAQALAGQPAAAQARGYVGFGGGVNVPIGTFNDAVKTGWLGQVVAGITGPKGRLGGRVDGTFARNGFDVGGGNFRLLGAIGDLVLSPMTGSGKTRPYFLAGLGFQSGKANTSTTSSTKFAFDFGLGLTIKAGRNAAVFGEGRYLSVHTDPDTFNMLPISIGVRFGGQ